MASLHEPTRLPPDFYIHDSADDSHLVSDKCIFKAI